MISMPYRKLARTIDEACVLLEDAREAVVADISGEAPECLIRYRLDQAAEALEGAASHVATLRGRSAGESPFSRSGGGPTAYGSAPFIDMPYRKLDRKLTQVLDLISTMLASFGSEFDHMLSVEPGEERSLWYALDEAETEIAKAQTTLAELRDDPDIRSRKPADDSIAANSDARPADYCDVIISVWSPGQKPAEDQTSGDSVDRSGCLASASDAANSSTKRVISIPYRTMQESIVEIAMQVNKLRANVEVEPDNGSDAGELRGWFDRAAAHLIDAESVIDELRGGTNRRSLSWWAAPADPLMMRVTIPYRRLARMLEQAIGDLDELLGTIDDSAKGLVWELADYLSMAAHQLDEASGTLQAMRRKGRS